MGWRILIGIATLVGLGTAVTEYDNLSLETSPAAYSRKTAPRPVYTASYGVAPGEYVLRGSDSGDENSAPSVQGFGFLPRDQAPPQEYLDLLRQAGVSEVEPQQQQQQHQLQQKGANRVIQQQYFGVQPSPPYPASGISPVSSFRLPPSPTPYAGTAPGYTKSSNNSPNRAYPPSAQNQDVALNFVPSSPYVTPLPETIPVTNKISKPVSSSSYRKTTSGGTAYTKDDSRQGSGKAVQLTYSLDYDLRTLHKEAESNPHSVSPSSSYYSPGSGPVVKGDEELLSKLAPEPEPLPFPLSGPSYYDSSRNTKKSKAKTSTSSRYEDEEPKIDVIKLPSPKGQRPITQDELAELIRAGYDIVPADANEGQVYQPTQENAAPQPPQGYARTSAPQQQLRLPKSRTVETPTQTTRYLSAPKSQSSRNSRPVPPNHNTYLDTAGTAPSADGNVSPYYQTPRPLPLPALHQKVAEPQVQAYQPGRSGIQQVEDAKVNQQNYQQEDDSQTQTYHTPGSYVSQSYPTAAFPEEQPLNSQAQNYPTATAQEQQQQGYPQITAQQAQLYHQQQLAEQIYQQPQTTNSRNEELSQPKEYVVPAPQRPKAYGQRVNQGYVPTSPSAAGNDGTLTYQHALQNDPQQGYGNSPTAPGASAPAEEDPTRIPQGRETYGRRNSRRRPSSHRESRVTYIRRYQGGATTGYSTEQ